MMPDLIHGVCSQSVAALGILQEFNEFIRKSDVLQERHQIHSSEEKKENNSKDKQQVLLTQKELVIIYVHAPHFMAA